MSAVFVGTPPSDLVRLAGTGVARADESIQREIVGIDIGGKCAGNKGGQNVKDSEHTSNKSPSNLEKHQKGQATKVNSAKVNDWKAYNKKGGKLSKTAWEKAGQPIR
jgi:hypothetical protein